MKRWMILMGLLAACDSGGDGGNTAEDAEVRPDMLRQVRDAEVVDMVVDAAPDAAIDAAVDMFLGDMGPRTACNDGLDNDRDGRVDFPDDPDCTDALDDDEAAPVAQPQCSDGLDNDNDGQPDLADSDCTGPLDVSESGQNPTTICSNGTDDDGDELTDFPFDPGCIAAGHNSEADPSPPPACANNMDDDANGTTDFPADPGCVAAGDETEAALASPPACANGVDDDESGATDWPADPGCDGAGDLTEVSPCGAGAPVINLNAHLADHAAYDGTLVDAPAHLVAECGGAAGGERIFLYTVEQRLDRLVFSTRHMETEAPVVMYLRDQCRGRESQCDRGLADDPGATITVTDPPVGATYFLVVDTGSRMSVGRFRLTVDAVRPPQCRDSEDNDGDGQVDLGDPGCEESEDNDELDPAEPPVCANDLDDDGDGRVDWPADPDCAAAGGPEEAPPCALNIPFVRVGQAGGDFPLAAVQGAGQAQGRCEPGLGAETVVVLTLTDPSDVDFQVLTAAGAPLQVTLHARDACADQASEIGCRRGAASMEPLRLVEVDRGTHYLFAEQGIVAPPGGILARVIVRSAIAACNDLIDNDNDGLVAREDPGCEAGRDDNERDPAGLPQCADGVDNDGNGVADWPNDEGCAAAGDPEEAPLGIPLGAAQGFGHHGSCDTWNACNNAQTCADAACRLNGHGAAISWQEGLCQDLARVIPNMRCSLFAQLPNNLDANWGNGCNIPVAYDVLCSP